MIIVALAAALGVPTFPLGSAVLVAVWFIYALRRP